MSAQLPQLPSGSLTDCLADDDFNEKLECENALILAVEQAESNDKFLTDTYESYSPLELALGRGYNKLAIKIMGKQNKESFLQSFKAVPDLFPRLLDFNEQDIPEELKPIIKNFRDRKILALLTGLQGRDTFFGITWEMEGHHDYQYVSKILFQLLAINKDKIMIAVEEEVMAEQQHGDALLIQDAIENTMVLMNDLQRLQALKEQEITPILVGTRVISGLHAEGFVISFVISGEQYLFVERESNRPGIIIYERSKDFDEETFNEFLVKAKKSSQGGLKTALDFEYYTNNTTASDFLSKKDDSKTREDLNYIPMSKQEKRNCTIASSEGLFLATLYSHLVPTFGHKEASELSRKCTEIIFKKNQVIEVSKLLKSKEISSQENLLGSIEFFKKLKERCESIGILDENLKLEFEKLQLALSPSSLSSASSSSSSSSSSNLSLQGTKKSTAIGQQYSQLIDDLSAEDNKNSILPMSNENRILYYAYLQHGVIPRGSQTQQQPSDTNNERKKSHERPKHGDKDDSEDDL